MNNVLTFRSILIESFAGKKAKSKFNQVQRCVCVCVCVCEREREIERERENLSDTHTPNERELVCVLPKQEDQKRE